MSAPRKNKPKSWRDTLPIIHPACELLPPLSEAELRVLGENIRQQGLVNKVTLFKEKIGPDEFEFSLLAGRSRLDAMELVGIDFEIQHTKRGKKDEWHIQIYDDIPEPLGPASPLIHVVENVDPYQHVISDDLHRRHLTAEGKRDVIEKLLKAQPEKSDRQIAKMAKADRETVSKNRKRLEATGGMPPVEKRVGADGKARKQPARKPVSKKKSTLTENDLEARLQLLELAFDELHASDLDIEKALPPFLARVKNNPTLLMTCVKEYLIQAVNAASAAGASS